jgi:hypothetical protein
MSTKVSHRFFDSCKKCLLVIIFDCSVHKTVVELDVRLPVTNVLLRRDRIIAATEERILVYSLNDIPEHLLTVETAQNPLGLCAISHTDVNSILIFPSKSIGHIGVLSLSHPQRRLKVFRAHNHDIQAISVNLNGTLLKSGSSYILFRYPNCYCVHQGHADSFVRRTNNKFST